jgi:ribosomal-protein-serine acetyltransferase
MFRAALRPGLDLRLLEDRHTDVLFALINSERDRLREWLPWVDATETVDDTRAFIRRSLEQFAADEGFAAGIWNNNALAGVIGTHKINWADRKVEIGYWLAREFEGQGIVTEACRAVVTHLFREMDLNRIAILCATGNTKSCAIPPRLGFRLEGTLREYESCSGAYLDLNVYAMLKREWAG